MYVPGFRRWNIVDTISRHALSLVTPVWNQDRTCIKTCAFFTIIRYVLAIHTYVYAQLGNPSAIPGNFQ